ncbi:DUF6678 family protein [Campylobacter rectus]|uniref:Uncharacterized protein n=1 Tax=Campylobacter rectus TaxID=203 RepID=A0A6G5QLQ1_CAMRE|nr:DUF6678 family protein [Campylobacter rectus]QCD46406.1 hypothetical protein CRECT_0721 [Campylobacter rectus]UEB47109.1 hypothetical protein LK437_08845 [Campylobacter rectus]
MQNLDEKYEIYQKRLGAKARRLTSLMNDTKWLKLCEILEASGCEGMRVKLLSSDEEIALVCGFGRLEDRYFDCANGAILFKNLRWVFVPKFYERARMNRAEKLASNFIPNPLEAVLDAMTKAGKFDYEMDESGLKIYGYG